MKRLLLILLLLPFISAAQKDIPKKADRIIISNAKTAEENFVLVKQTLADQNVEIANQDKDIFQIKSGIMNITKYGANGYYIFSCKDNKVIVTGQYKTGIEMSVSGVNIPDNYSKIENRGMKSSITREAFNKMNEFSKKLGSEISYEVSNN